MKIAMEDYPYYPADMTARQQRRFRAWLQPRKNLRWSVIRCQCGQWAYMLQGYAYRPTSFAFPYGEPKTELCVLPDPLGFASFAAMFLGAPPALSKQPVSVCPMCGEQHPGVFRLLTTDRRYDYPRFYGYMRTLQNAAMVRIAAAKLEARIAKAKATVKRKKKNQKQRERRALRKELVNAARKNGAIMFFAQLALVGEARTSEQ